ncbi:hypothetical protein YIM_28840 [Amycolatopsis sp. YIM 10]|nr:hypothetical protein YIM_28840 [Amycolatopsis sp. YIM 10]
MPKPIATWNSARGVWETGRIALLCGHSELYSATWPTSGMTRSGVAYELPTWAPPTNASASLLPQLLGTPRCADGITGALRPNPDPGKSRLEDQLAVLLLKTPTAQLAVNGGSQHPDKRKAGGHGPTLADEVEHLLPTPAARDWKSGASNIMDRNSRPLNEVVVNRLLPTPTVSNANGGNKVNNQSTKLLPGVVAELTGAPTAPPFINGNASSNVPPPTPPCPEPAADVS